MTKYVWAGLSITGFSVLSTALLLMSGARAAQAHCQVPCGIYDDAARIARLREDAATIAKATKNINEMAGQHGARSVNQVTRWIHTKEDHASHIIEVVAQYFLTQRVKPVAAGADTYEAYLKKLGDHHAVMVAAMKTKQNVDDSLVDDLVHAIDGMARHYE